MFGTRNDDAAHVSLLGLSNGCFSQMLTVHYLFAAYYIARIDTHSRSNHAFIDFI